MCCRRCLYKGRKLVHHVHLGVSYQKIPKYAWYNTGKQKKNIPDHILLIQCWEIKRCSVDGIHHIYTKNCIMIGKICLFAACAILAVNGQCLLVSFIILFKMF